MSWIAQLLAVPITLAEKRRIWNANNYAKNRKHILKCKKIYWVTRGKSKRQARRRQSLQTIQRV